MIKSVIVLNSVVLVLLFSCASSPPDRIEPDLGITPPERWTSPYPLSYGQIKYWWEEFGDPALNELIERTLERNFDVKAALARLDAAQAQARIEGADGKPLLDGSFSASRRRQNVAGIPFTQGSDEVVRSTTNSFGASLNLSWEIDLWGRLRSGHAAALAQIEASRSDLEGIRLSIAAQTAKAWFACIEAALQLHLAQSSLDNYTLTLEKIRVRYERGLRSSLDLRLAESNVSSARSVLYLGQDQLQRLLRQLEIVSGRYPAGLLETGCGFPQKLAPVPVGIPAEIISRRPDLVSSERRLASSKARVVQSEAALYPRIALTASGGRASDELADLLIGEYTLWSIAGSLLQPLFQAGRLRAGVDLAQAREDEAAVLFARNVLVAYAEVESALTAETLLSFREQALVATVEQALAARDLAEERYLSGLVDYISLLEAQRGAYESQSQLLSVKRQRLDARIDLYLALGGGFMSLDNGGWKNEEE